MKLRSLAGVGLLSISLALTSCSMLYPGQNPTPTQTETPTPTETPTETPTPTVDPNLKQTTITIIDSNAFRDNGYVQVIASVDGVMEDDGKCTLVVTQNGQGQSVEVKAESNVTSTQCYPMEVPIASFKNGTAKFTVTYVSDASTGTNSGTVQIQ